MILNKERPRSITINFTTGDGDTFFGEELDLLDLDDLTTLSVKLDHLMTFVAMQHKMITSINTYAQYNKESQDLLQKQELELSQFMKFFSDIDDVD